VSEDPAVEDEDNSNNSSPEVGVEAEEEEEPGSAPILIINNSTAPQYIVVPSLGLIAANQPAQQLQQVKW
jgi:hypothetical protein